MIRDGAQHDESDKDDDDEIIGNNVGETKKFIEQRDDQQREKVSFGVTGLQQSGKGVSSWNVFNLESAPMWLAPRYIMSGLTLFACRRLIPIKTHRQSQGKNLDKIRNNLTGTILKYVRTVWPSIILNEVSIAVTSTIRRQMPLVLLWWTLSSGLSLFNKKVLGKSTEGDLGFPAPLFLTACQFFIESLLASAWRRCKRTLTAGVTTELAERGIWSSLCEYLSRYVVAGVSTGLDIGLSNWSLLYINVSFHTMIKSSAPLFIILFAFAFKLEAISWSLGAIMLLISVGLLLTVKGEDSDSFSIIGILLALGSTIMAGLRWNLTQIIVQRGGCNSHKNGRSALTTIYFLAPIMAGTVMVFSLAKERLWTSLPNSSFFSSTQASFETVAVIVSGGLIAFSMVLAELTLLQLLGATSLTILGICKEIILIAVATLMNGDHLGAANVVGLMLVIFGVILYNIHRLADGDVHKHDADRHDTHTEEETL